MQRNKHGIPVHQVKSPKKRVKPNYKLEQVHMSKDKQVIQIPNFQPVREVLTAYGWELREVTL